MSDHYDELAQSYHNTVEELARVRTQLAACESGRVCLKARVRELQSRKDGSRPRTIPDFTTSEDRIRRRSPKH